LLQPWIFAQENSNIADERNEADHASDHILLAVQEGLALGVELGIVCKVVVTLGEKAEGGFAGATLAYASETHVFLTLLCNNLSMRYPPPKDKWANSLSSVSPDHAMHDWNVLALHIVHHDLANLRIQTPIPQEQQISSLERGLHGP
jgi:hypothetical protein